MVWKFIHNYIAHPLLEALPFSKTHAFHEWTAKKAWPTAKHGEEAEWPSVKLPQDAPVHLPSLEEAKRLPDGKYWTNSGYVWEYGEARPPKNGERATACYIPNK